MARIPDGLNPKRSLAAALGWALSALFLLGAYAASYWVGALTRNRLEAQTGELYKQYALQISNVLDNSLHDRLQWIRAMADVFATHAVEQNQAQQRAFLERLQNSLPELAWIGFVAPDGKVLAGTGGVLDGQSVSEQPWFLAGRRESWIGDVTEAVSLAKVLKPLPPIDRPRLFIDLATPVRDADNGILGVIGAHLSWGWATQLEGSLTEGLKSGHTVESLIVDRSGKALLGPESLTGSIITLPGKRSIGDVGYVVHEWPDGGKFLAGYAVSDGAGTFAGLGWTVWVREATSSAFADARALEHRIFVGMLLLGLIGALVSALSVRRLTRELSTIARSADEIRIGKSNELVVPSGSDEAARIGRSLRTLVDGLQTERSALRELNAELDARVAARTREVERMSEENKYAAVVRERLRMARDLHDTLAHSMMAMLTEVRLLRKLVDINPAALSDELAHAEAAAQAGLNEARSAIQALRHNAVRDFGLGAALAQLFTRFEERRSIPASFASDAGADALADSRAETLYRIVEEALQNVDRHAGATRVEGSATILRRPRADGSDGTNEVLRVSVSDDGVGFDPDAIVPGHFGVRGMREQADLIGARVTIVSTPGSGTQVIVEMQI